MDDDGSPGRLDAPHTQPMAGAEELQLPRRSSVNVDSRPIRAAARVDASAVEAAPASLEHRFAVEARLGGGGMGTVQRALDRRLLREVAVKIIHGHLDWGPHQARFAREAQITAQLEHPHIVPVYSFERSAEGSSAIVMRLIDGQTLHGYIRSCRRAVEAREDRSPPYSLQARLERLIKVCDAVQYAHDHGVIHRDLKPANIMLGGHGQVYVMDWGLAGVVGVPDEDVIRQSIVPAPSSATDPTDSGARRRESSGPSPALTREGDIFGTPQYMSPEQARGEIARLGPASDQFALGLMLFELAFLEPPRGRKKGEELVAAAAQGWVETPRSHAAGGVPEALQAVVDRATAREPTERYPSVGALADDLRKLLRGEPPSVVHESPLQRAWRRFNQHPVRAMRTVLGLVLAAAVVVSGSLWLKLRAERVASYEKGRVAELSAEVGERAQHIEAALGQVEALVQGWAKAAEQALGHSQPIAPAALSSDALREAGPAAGLRFSSRHGQPVSYEHASYVAAPGADRAEVRAQLGKLAHLTPYLERWLGADDPLARAGPPAPLVGGSLPLLWIYLALESGVLVTYPGNVSYPEGYDPRTRPWYREGRQGDTHWRSPYRSVSGGEVQLPCVAELRDAEGRFVGVVGMDLALSDLRERLRVDSQPAWRASYLLDAQAHVLVSTSLEPGGGTPAGDLGQHGVELVAFPVEAVRGRLRRGSVGGALEQDDTLFVMQRLRSLGWTLVVAFERLLVY